ncbi:MAG: MBL fold metallo-hydrolase [Hungatella sp.]
MKELNMKICVLGKISTNCYILYRKETTGDALSPAVVIDPGDNAPYIHNCCKELGIRPTAILLTHGHFDHILAAEELRRTYHIPIYACETEERLLELPEINLSSAFGESVFLTADYLLRDGQELDLLGVDWKVITTPGHTAGSLCYWIPTEGVLLSGDTLFHESMGRTDLPTSSSASICHSILDKLFLLPEETKVYPGHGDSTTIAHEKQYNPAAAYKA